MKEKCLSGENPALQPNLITYNIVLDSYARAGQSTEALEMLEEMADQYGKGFLDNGPSTMSYTCCISSFGRGKNKYWIEPEEAEKVFRKMLSLNNPKLKPEQICWTSLIDVYAKAAIFGDDRKDPTPSQCLDRAEELLIEMLDSGVKATVVTYNTILKAIAFSKFDTDRPVRAKKILDMMKDRGVRADDYTRSVVSDVMEKEQERRRQNSSSS
jgi:pentatricopeptide repeat protein